MDDVNPAFDPAVSPQIPQQLLRGNKLEAIKPLSS
jgi:hypothetical protein